MRADETSESIARSFPSMFAGAYSATKEIAMVVKVNNRWRPVGPGKRHGNGMTDQQMRDWSRACKYSVRYCRRMFNREWHDDRIAGEYMAARNGYLAGYKAALRASKGSKRHG